MESDPAAARSGPPLTLHLGPEDLLLNLDIQFRAGLWRDELIQTVDRLEQTLRENHPEIRRIFLEIERLRQRDGPPARTPRAAAEGTDRATRPSAAGRPSADDGGRALGPERRRSRSGRSRGIGGRGENQPGRRAGQS